MKRFERYVTSLKERNNMAKQVWAISHLKDNPPKRIPYYPIDESKEWITTFCQVANEGHQKAGTGFVFKVFSLDQ